MNEYKRPDVISSDMGGTEEVLDERMQNILELLEQAPLENMETFLDIGMGKGQLAKFLARKGKKVTGIGLELASYEASLNKLKQDFGIESVECNIESMPFEDNSFDGVVMSHVLEHCMNVGIALKEVRRVLKDDGMLFVFVPPHETRVCAGHVAIGWNIGQLMYVLLVNGFDVKEGHFIQYGYNVVAFVKKNKRPLPPLRSDEGDIHILNKEGFFPAPIKTADGKDDGFFGNLISVNWDREFVDKMIQKNADAIVVNNSPFFPRTLKKVAKMLMKPLSNQKRTKLSQKLMTLANIAYGDQNKESPAINPEILGG